MAVPILTNFLSAGDSGQIRIRIETAASTNGALDALWFGTQQTTYNFTGDQVQLKFAGSGTLTLAASTTYLSDFSKFTYLGTGSALLVRAHFSGTTVNLASVTTTPATPNYSLLGADQSSVTSPTGSWSTATNDMAMVNKIETQFIIFKRLNPLLRR